MQDSLQRILKLKVAILAIIVVLTGLALLFLAKWISTQPELHWLHFWPISEVGSTLFATGGLVVAWNYVDGRDRERREDERLRALLAESAPAFRDAVVRGFAVDSDDLKRVATPQLLDSIATNVLSLRLGDRQFAEETYTDIRDQAVAAPERWYDCQIFIRLAPARPVSSTRDAAPRNFAATVRWEYTVAPSHPVRSFVCASDPTELRDLQQDAPATLAWSLTPRTGVSAADRTAFELVDFTVDGEPHAIRRLTRKSSQTYRVTIGEEVVSRGEPVRLSYTYTTLVQANGHLLHFDIGQPTRNLSIAFDYTDCPIERVSVLDLIGSSQRASIERSPPQVPGRVIRLDFDGWLFPRSGFAFVWTLERESARGATKA